MASWSNREDSGSGLLHLRREAHGAWRLPGLRACSGANAGDRQEACYYAHYLTQRGRCCTLLLVLGVVLLRCAVEPKGGGQTVTDEAANRLCANDSQIWDKQHLKAQSGSGPPLAELRAAPGPQTQKSIRGDAISQLHGAVTHTTSRL